MVAAPTKLTDQGVYVVGDLDPPPPSRPPAPVLGLPYNCTIGHGVQHAMVWLSSFGISPAVRPPMQGAGTFAMASVDS